MQPKKNDDLNDFTILFDNYTDHTVLRLCVRSDS